MIEDYDELALNPEEFDDSLSIDERNSLSDLESSYISEVIPFHDGDLIASRIDELGNSTPPKAIDSNESVSQLLEPVRDEIDTTYLEAPSDSVQIESAVSCMNTIDGLSFNEWSSNSMEERVMVLENIENNIAKISHRPPCRLVVEDLGDSEYGHYVPGSDELHINSRYLESDSFNDYKETIDTVIHEGRHAYQDYNMNVREVHPRSGEIDNWKRNENGEVGYINADEWGRFFCDMGYCNARKFGLELYQNQPVEADASAFAADIVSKYLKGQVA